MTHKTPSIISGSVMRLRVKCPFFAVLAMHAPWIEDSRYSTLATDGHEVRFNLSFLESLTTPHRDFVIAHEVAHVALRHVSRLGSRNPMRWNIAADIVVNGLLMDRGLKMPPGGLSDPSLAHLRVEDVYVKLGRDIKKLTRKLGQREGSKWRDLCGPEGLDGVQRTAKTESAVAKDRSHQDAVWRAVIQRAHVAQRLHDDTHGHTPPRVSQEVLAQTNPSLDWRTLLWRFMAQTPTNYVGFDRRFIQQGRYLDCLQGERLTVAVCVDTSGSIHGHMLRDFMSELQGILQTHPHIKMKVYFADAALYGPWWVTSDDELPTPRGGGGTDFRPFFEAITQPHNEDEPVNLLIYLTDGYGCFPPQQPDKPVLWCVPDGGIAESDLPWGEIARMEVA